MTEPTDPVWRINVKPKAEKQLARMPRNERERIINALLRLRSGFACDVKALNGRPEWRLRVGKWRVLLDVDESARTVAVLTVGSRGDIYKD